MLAGSRLIEAVAILDWIGILHATTARDDDGRLEEEGMAAKPRNGSGPKGPPSFPGS